MRQYRFFVPGPLPGLNDIIEAAKGAGGRGTKYATLKKRWTEAVFWRVREARAPKFNRASFVFHWTERDRAR